MTFNRLVTRRSKSEMPRLHSGQAPKETQLSGGQERSGGKVRGFEGPHQEGAQGHWGLVLTSILKHQLSGSVISEGDACFKGSHECCYKYIARNLIFLPAVLKNNLSGRQWEGVKADLQHGYSR